ncbi:MAG TPA: hypothetical protein VF141_07530, partial [Chryseolinea sp.]
MKHTFVINFQLTPMCQVLIGVLLFSSCSNKNSDDMMQKPLRNYKVAMLQMEVEAGKLEANLARAQARIAAAAQQGAQIALLP